MLILLLPAWVGSLTLCLLDLRSPATSPFYLHSAQSAEQYPTIGGFWPWADPQDYSPRVGDRLLRMGEVGMQGKTQLDFRFSAFQESDDRSSLLQLTVERDGRTLELEISTRIPRFYAPLLITSLVTGLIGVLLLLSAPESHTVRALFHYLIVSALFNSAHYGGGDFKTWASTLQLGIMSTLMLPLMVRAFRNFPEELERPKGWHRWWPWIFLLMGPLQSSNSLAIPFAPDSIGLIFGVAIFCFLVVAIGVFTLNYRRASRVGRRQMKWVVYGAYLGVIPLSLAAVVIALGRPVSGLALSLLVFFGTVLFPIGVLIAIRGSHLFDIDRLITSTAIYNVLLILVVVGVMTFVPSLSRWLAGFLKQQDYVAGQVGISIVFASLVVPVQRRLRPRIERIFFAERHAVEAGIQQLLTDLAACRSPEQLLTETGDQFNRLLRPEACVIYGRTGDAFQPIFRRGRSVPPVFEGTGALMQTLERSGGEAIAVDRKLEAVIADVDRALLASLGAEILVPVVRQDKLEAFVALARKGSGDIFTSTDRALLTAVAKSLSTHLLRFDQDEILDRARTMQEALRRYVPGAVADEIASGRDLQSGEAEVSVVFVDIRGYTAFSEDREAGEIFSTVNSYTSLVSELVREHGGSVVEFNGDGMMAVFGAPKPVSNKERSAVQAGLRIVDSVKELPVDGGEPLSVGVGVATGQAFVGNIRAVDRDIWSAIGNTTNLSARLQGMTRDLAASMVIDAATWNGAGDVGAPFEHLEHVTIRGRRQSEDLYLLRLAATNAET